MSSAEYRLDLSPAAQRDVIDILRHTGETWGNAQILVYRDQLDAALERIHQNPKVGHLSEHLPKTHQLYLVGSHVIIYRVDGSVIGVIRILHQRMNWIEHL